MAELDALKQEADALLGALQSRGQEETVQQPAGTEQPPVPQEEVIQAPTGSIIGDLEQAGFVPAKSQNISNDFEQAGFRPAGTPAPEEIVEDEVVVEEPSTDITGAIDALSDKEELTVDDIANLSFEQIVSLADVSSPLQFSARQQLSNALRGSTTTGLGEVLVGTPFSSDELETALEEKYQDFVSRNPDQARSLLGRAGEALMTGSPVNNLISDDSQTVNPEFRAITDSIGNAAFGEFGDELYASLGMEGVARSLDASNQQLDENDVTGDAVITDLLGAVLPASRVAQALGTGTRAVAAAGAIEGAVQGAGAAEGSAGERIDDAAIGAALGSVLGGASSKLLDVGSNLINNSSFRRKAMRILNTTVDDINSALPSGEKITLQELANSGNEGETLIQFMARKGIPDSTSRDIAEKPAKGSPALLDDMRTQSERRIARTQNQLAQQRTEVGQEVDAARNAIPLEELNDVVREMSNTNAGNMFIEEGVKPVVRESLETQDDVVKQLGYTSSSQVPIVVNRSNGKIYMVEAVDGKAPKANPDGTYADDVNMQEFLIYGEDFNSIKEHLLNPIRTGLKQGDVDQVRSQRVKPFIDRQTELLNRNTALSEANKKFEDVVARQEAVDSAASGRRSYISYDEALKGTDMPSDLKDSLGFLAKEMDVLNNVGKRANRSSPVREDIQALRDFSLGSLAGRGFGKALQITGVKYLMRALRGDRNLTNVSRSERKIQPILRYFINGTDEQLDDLVQDMAAQGVKTESQFNKWLTERVPLIADIDNAASVLNEALGANPSLAPGIAAVSALQEEEAPTDTDLLRQLGVQ